MNATPLVVSSTPAPIKVLVVAPNDHGGDPWRKLIESRHGFVVVANASDPASALEAARNHRPDVVIFDGDLPVDSLGSIIAAGRGARAIVITRPGDTTIQSRAIHFGAIGFVERGDAEHALHLAITKVHQGEAWFERRLVAKVIEDLRTGSRGRVDEAISARVNRLTPREREVIALVGEGLKNRVIAQRLGLSESTVRHHLTAVFDKLGVADRLELVILAFKLGLVHFG